MTDGEGTVGTRPMPPLFIKIEKYREVIQSIQQLRSYALSLRDALDALSDIERELSTGLEITHKALDKFNNILSILDVKLSRAHFKGRELGEIERGIKAQTPTEIEDYVKNLYDQMEKIRSELKGVNQ